MRYVILLLMLLTFGCGGSSSESVSTVPLPPSNDGGMGTIVVQHTLERSLTAEVTLLRFAGFDAAGRLTFGPEDHARAPEIRLRAPLTTRTLTIEYFSDSKKLGSYRGEVELRPEQETLVADPGWTQGQGLHIVPQQFLIFPHTYGHLQILDRHDVEVTPQIFESYDQGIILYANGDVQASGPLVGGSILAFYQGEQTSAQYQVVEPSSIVALSLPPTTRATIGTSNTTLVPTLGPYNVLGGSWTTSDPSVATVDYRGVVTGVNYGTATVTVTVGVVQASTQVQVVETFPLSLQIEPENPSGNFDQDITFSVMGYYSDGTVKDVTNFCDFTSSDPSICEMNGFNIGNLGEYGSCSVTASYQGLTSSTTVNSNG